MTIKAERRSALEEALVGMPLAWAGPVEGPLTARYSTVYVVYVRAGRQSEILSGIGMQTTRGSRILATF